MKTQKKVGIVVVLLALILFTAGAFARRAQDVATPSPEPLVQQDISVASVPPANVSMIFVENSDGTDGGPARMFQSMRNHGINLHQSAASPSGLIASQDVVILKINAQWDQRGGTNTDLVRSVIREILNHPDGFAGEIIIADNGQAQFGSAPGGGGSLDFARNNAVDQSQSNLRVIRYFQNMGYRVTGVLWDTFTRIRVQEFSAGDMNDGFVVEDVVRNTNITVSYPKFTTEFGTHVSFRYGIWNPATRTYNSDILKVINMPVLKSHRGFQVTAAVKNWMGVPSDMLTRQLHGGRGRAHNSVGTGGMGTLLAYTRMPVLNIMDMIWVAPEDGPRSLFTTAVQVNKIAASKDPVAIDHWASRNVLMPVAPARIRASMNPDGTQPGTFGHLLRLSMNELHRAGIWATMNEAEMRVIGP